MKQGDPKKNEPRVFRIIRIGARFFGVTLYVYALTRHRALCVLEVGICLKENYSAESEYLRRQDVNSKSGEEQKKKVITSVEVLISTQIRIQSKKKVKMMLL